MDSGLDAYASPRNDESDSLRQSMRSATLSPRHSGARVARARNPSNLVLPSTMDSGLDAYASPRNDERDSLRHGMRSATLSPRHSGARVARARNPSNLVLPSTMDS